MPPRSRSLPEVMKPSARILVGLIALLAMSWVQAFKPVRGFECVHDGVHIFTLQEHCHGPHSVACHANDAEVPFHTHDDLPADDDTEHHQALVESLTALKAESGHWVMPPIVSPMLFANVAMAWSVRECEFLPQALTATPPDGRRWPQILSHSIALLI